MPRKNKIQSLTTPGHKMLARSWISELVMWRANFGHLPPYFWRQTKWKWRYTNEVKAASKFIKKYGESTVVKIVCANKKLQTLASYGELEFLLQAEQDRLKRLATPKDNTPVIDKVRAPIEDLRGPRSINTKKGLFEKLDGLN